jgi:hypothetical protein
VGSVGHSAGDLRNAEVTTTLPLACASYEAHGTTADQRDLNDSQRGYYAAAPTVLSHFEAEAKKRQREGGAKGGRGSASIGAERSEVAHRAVDDAAIAFDTSPRQVQRGKLVIQKGCYTASAPPADLKPLGRRDHDRLWRAYPDVVS